MSRNTYIIYCDSTSFSSILSSISPIISRIQVQLFPRESGAMRNVLSASSPNPSGQPFIQASQSASLFSSGLPGSAAAILSKETLLGDIVTYLCVFSIPYSEIPPYLLSGVSVGHSTGKFLLKPFRQFRRRSAVFTDRLFSSFLIPVHSMLSLLLSKTVQQDPHPQPRQVLFLIQWSRSARHEVAPLLFPLQHKPELLRLPIVIQQNAEFRGIREEATDFNAGSIATAPIPKQFGIAHHAGGKNRLRSHSTAGAAGDS